MITPNQIKEKQLATAAHGYDIDETNAFLDEIADSYSAIFQENKELYRKMEILANKIVEYREEEDSIKEAIISAQKAANELEKTAKEKADKLSAESDSKAKKTVADAKAEAEKLISEARDYVANLTKEKTAAANEIAMEAEKKAGSILSNAKNAVQDMFKQTKSLSEELIVKAKEEKEYHEELVSKLKEESELFKTSLVSLYEAQLAKLKEMMESPVEAAKALAADKMADIENQLNNVDNFVESITGSAETKKEDKAENAPAEKEDVKEEEPAEDTKVEEKAQDTDQVQEPAEDAAEEEEAEDDSACEPEADEENTPQEAPVIAVKDAEDIEDISEQSNVPSMIDVDVNDAIEAFDKDEITPVEGHPVTEITEEPEMEPAGEPEKGYNEELPFESFFNVKAEGRTTEKISLIPPDDYDEDEDDLKFRGFFKKKNKKHN